MEALRREILEQFRTHTRRYPLPELTTLCQVTPLSFRSAIDKDLKKNAILAAKKKLCDVCFWRNLIDPKSHELQSNN